MSRNTRVLATTPDRVWDVLADGWLYPLWVVGATRMREVDDGWPAPGTRLHHSVGVWPVVINDDTEVLECDPGKRLVLRAKGWPPGEAEDPSSPWSSDQTRMFAHKRWVHFAFAPRQIRREAISTHVVRGG